MRPYRGCTGDPSEIRKPRPSLTKGGRRSLPPGQHLTAANAPAALESFRGASFLGAGASIRSTATTTSSFQGQRLGISGALSARIASGLRRTHGGGGSRLAFGLAGQPRRCLRWLGSCGLPWPALPRGVRGGSPTLRGLPKAEPNLISSRPSQMTGL